MFRRVRCRSFTKSGNSTLRGTAPILRVPLVLGFAFPVLLAIELLTVTAARGDSYSLVDSLESGGTSIAVTNDAVYVVGPNVLKLSLDLTSIGGWTANATAISANNNFVCVVGPSGTDWFSSAGIPLAHADAGATVTYGSVALHLDGRAIVESGNCDSLWTPMLVELGMDGTAIDCWLDQDHLPDDIFRDLALTPDGTLLVVDWFDGDATTSVKRFLPPDQLNFLFTTQALCQGPASDGPDIFSIGVDPAGNIYACDGCDGMVEKHDPSGHLLARWSCGERAEDVTGDAAGNVYVLTATHVWKYAPDQATPTRQVSWGQVKARWR